ncbi:DNA methyltransferase [Xanthomonas oryzae pv. oryzicola]|uniref:DNA adenine methylase n=1 Tax=Xanthomonas oryzae TaxID=347 RepID=UPI0006557B93|nr:DNA adenine methylase [Xanthomonas oryzae]AKN95057.1 DNA methyltransferase [Xanthomonas oryzae pv. oryzicola]AKN98785.1 DNA methyltransferase [Xanthomonas oryzae pv. oryzicola]AKO14007.1 DNA methyltransferase [Xanthomonas oryzae pv. oryzicola]AKO17745.1 DNA methyltransferase [Xanthomonas oryzae pv. oryzicola]
MPVTDSPLRYPGGKTQLAPFVIEILRKNDLFYGSYIEPFAGGCGIAWKLLLDAYVSEIHINDIDSSIYAFWASVLRKTDDLCELIETTPVTMEEWYRQKTIQQDRRARQLELGFSTLFLNRTNRSGILKGGVIGGKGQESAYPLDCRFNKTDLVRKIQRIAKYKDQVTLTRIDAEDFILGTLPKLAKKGLVNIDPPYYGKGRDLYCSFYKHEDHASLAKVIPMIGQRWMVTYDNAPEIQRLYKKYPSINMSLNYSAQVKRVGVELMVIDPKLKLPDENQQAA